MQSLEQASQDVWTSSFSGVGSSSKTVSYYVKGPVVGFLLDARIRRATKGAKTLDDVMKLAYKHYSGERGFTEEQFRKIAEEVAGVDLKEWYSKAISSTEELDYAEALEWFGLRFASPEGAQAEKTWKLEVRPDATEAQKARRTAWLGEGAASAPTPERGAQEKSERGPEPVAPLLRPYGEGKGREPDAPSKDERPRARRAKQGRAIKGFPLALAWRVGLAGPESRLTSWHSEQTTLLLET